MYHIRRVDTKDERSIHQETPYGLRQAQGEAKLRAIRQQTDIEIVTDEGRLVQVCSYNAPPPRRARLIERPYFLITAFLTAVVVWGLLHG